MKSLVEVVNEARKQYMEPEEIKGPVTVGSYNGEPVVIIGKPFTNENDEQYAIAQEYLRKLGIKSLTMTLKDCYSELGDEAENIEYWVIAVLDGEASVFTYDNGGVVAEK